MTVKCGENACVLNIDGTQYKRVELKNTIKVIAC